MNDIIYSSIGITVLGHDCWAKAAVANELFGQKILPTEPQDAESDNSKLSWRMVMFLENINSLLLKFCIILCISTLSCI